MGIMATIWICLKKERRKTKKGHAIKDFAIVSDQSRGFSLCSQRENMTGYSLCRSSSKSQFMESVSREFEDISRRKRQAFPTQDPSSTLEQRDFLEDKATFMRRIILCTRNLFSVTNLVSFLR